MALSMPTGTPISQENSTAIIAIWAEMGPRRAIKALIGSLVQKDVPKSPVMTSRIQSKY